MLLFWGIRAAIAKVAALLTLIAIFRTFMPIILPCSILQAYLFSPSPLFGRWLHLSTPPSHWSSPLPFLFPYDHPTLYVSYLSPSLIPLSFSYVLQSISYKFSLFPQTHQWSLTVILFFDCERLWCTRRYCSLTFTCSFRMIICVWNTICSLGSCLNSVLIILCFYFFDLDFGCSSCLRFDIFIFAFLFLFTFTNLFPLLTFLNHLISFVSFFHLY